MGKIGLARVDSRLAHSQMVKMWGEKYGLEKVIIANDLTASDSIRVEVMDLTVPEEIGSFYLKVAEVGDFLKKNEESYLLLVESTSDLEKILDQGILDQGIIEEVNLGIIHLSKGKKSLTELVALDDEDLRILKRIKDKGIKISVKKLPEDLDEIDKLGIKLREKY